MPLPPAKVAFVTGVNGITGNALVEHLIRQPRSQWSDIIISSRSPLKTYWQDPRVQFVAIDFLNPVDKIIAGIASVCRGVTHAFYASYVHVDDFAELAGYNVPLFKNFLTAIDTVAGSSLQRVCLQTGGKHYGMHLGPIVCPTSEDHPRYDDQGLNFYYPQEDFMFDLQSRRNWSYSIIRPNAIIGFTPGKNGMSEALTLALYLLVNKELGQVPVFPGNRYSYNSPDDNSYVGGVADISVWAMTQEHTKNEAFNYVNGDAFVWRYFYKRLGQYFGIDIPDHSDSEQSGDGANHVSTIHMAEWAHDKKDVWNRICDKYGGNKEAFDWGTWDFMDWAVGRAWPCLSSMTKAREFGFTRYDDTFKTWVETFKCFENAGILPRNEAVNPPA